MPCLVAVIALAMPRVAVAALWFFSDWFRGVFDTALWPVLGFVFLPTSLLWYSVVVHWFDGAWTLWPVAGMVVAVLMDLSPTRRRRAADRD